MAINNTQRKLLAAVKAIGGRNEVADVQRIADEIEFSDTASIMVWLGRLTHDEFLQMVKVSNSYVITDADKPRWTMSNERATNSSASSGSRHY